MVQKTKLRDNRELIVINNAIDLANAGCFDKAINLVKRKLNSVHYFSFFIRGWKEQAINNHAKAISYFEQSLIKNPLNEDAITGLASSYLELGEFSKAEECAEQLLLLNNKRPQNYLTYALVLSKKYKGNLEKQLKATDNFSKAFHMLRAEFDNSSEHIRMLTDILTGWGASILSTHNYSEAVALLNSAEDFSPGDPLINKNLASAHSSLMNIDEAIQSCQKAQKSEEYEIVMDSLYQEGMLQLLKGDFQKGWRLCEFRLNTQQFQGLKNYNIPNWNGEPIPEDKKLLIYQEQGLGDLLQFSRYIPLVHTRAANIDIEIIANQYAKWDDATAEPKSFRSFLHNNYSEFVTDSFVRGWHKNDYSKYAYKVSFMSLPRIFRTGIDTIPAIPNFKAFEVSSDVQELPMYDIGILWQGSKSHNNDINRSVPIKHIKQFVQNNSNLSFINLQLNNDEDLSDISNISCHSDKIKTLDDTLVILQKCKIVITVDSMIAHLAGSANIPTYILHAYSPDWRWLIDRRDSPWYPSITNIRQKQLRDWHSVFDQLDQEIKSVFDSKINID
jgi:tetratricopeptide (TPR) repeat protein